MVGEWPASGVTRTYNGGSDETTFDFTTGVDVTSAWDGKLLRMDFGGGTGFAEAAIVSVDTSLEKVTVAGNLPEPSASMETATQKWIGAAISNGTPCRSVGWLWISSIAPPLWWGGHVGDG